MRGYLLFAVLSAGCASASSDAGSDASTPTDGEVAGDAGPDSPPDAPDLPVTVTLAQTTNPTIQNPNTGNCRTSEVTRENSYYRVFPLAEYGITKPFRVQHVQFAVQTAFGGGGTQSVSVKVGTYAGAVAPNTAGLDPAQWAPLAAVAATVNDGSNQTITTPIDVVIPAGSKLMVELYSPDAGNWFIPGSNAGGESYPSFIRMPDCASACAGICNYATIPDTVHLILTVTGSH